LHRSFFENPFGSHKSILIVTTIVDQDATWYNNKNNLECDKLCVFLIFWVGIHETSYKIAMTILRMRVKYYERDEDILSGLFAILSSPL
jgi:hypothetical protein